MSKNPDVGTNTRYGENTQWAEINIRNQNRVVEIYNLNEKRFDCRTVHKLRAETNHESSKRLVVA